MTNSSGIDEIVGDGKIKEFMDYIERIDNNASDKLQFKEFSEQSKRQRYPSYNFEGDKSQIDDDDDEILKDYSVIESTDGVAQLLPNDIELKSNVNETNTKRPINNRKPNMFALPKPMITIDNEIEQSAVRPVIRITSTEDERIEQFLHENDESYNITPDATNQYPHTADILIKSKTTQLLFDSNENLNEMYAMVEQPDSGIDSQIFGDDVRRESLLSEMSSDSNQIDFKASPDAKYFNREDSSTSNKSIALFERSQSRLSELEYIRGRDDWKEHYGISGEIDSDNYHHLRRHSEAGEALEYIRGRDDWFKNQMNFNQRPSLPRIFEGGEQKIVIQDEIDSDEYHHNLFWNDSFRSASESNTIESERFENNFGKLMKETATSESASDFEEISNTEINDVIENIIKHDEINREDIEITVLDLKTDATNSQIENHQENIFEPFIIISNAMDDDDEREHSMEMSMHQQQPNPDERGSHFSFIQNMRNAPTEECNNLNSLGKNQNEIISMVENKFDNTEPCIETEFEIISENSVVDVLDVVNEKLKTHKFLQNEIQTENQQKHVDGSGDDVAIGAEIKCESVNDESLISKKINMNIHSKIPSSSSSSSSESSSSSSSSPLADSNKKAKQSLKCENIEDLIRDVSLGPWFHK